jgi:GH25 family lysozyme M1 (1,4-beta-N-acetylmuramidase)|nr:MAG TPA: hypothetical protein [Caudoviricetes sp.]
MLNFIDISNHQGRAGLTDLSPLLSQIDGVVAKATEGTNFVDAYCDSYVQQLIKTGKLWGFYHYAKNGSPAQEAYWFYKNCANYFGYGIPILDWEEKQDVNWVNSFVRQIHDTTGIWPWIYGNPWRFNQGGVEPNCMRWLAAYPNAQHPTFTQAQTWEPPTANGVVGAWQFCSDGRLNGWDGNLDCNLFYGNETAWRKYAGVAHKPEQPEQPSEPQWKITESSRGKIVLEKV